MAHVKGLNNPAYYGVDVSSPLQSLAYRSFKLSRPLVGSEQLDLSRGLESECDVCAVFLHSYWPWDSPGKLNARRKWQI